MKDFHEGVIGIVASPIKREKYIKPVVIISINNQIGKASARSINGFDIGSAIISAVQNKILISGGGHKMAIGFSLNINNIDKFKNFIFKKFSIAVKEIDKEKTLFLDSIISSSAINFDFYKK